MDEIFSKIQTTIIKTNNRIKEYLWQQRYFKQIKRN